MLPRIAQEVTGLGEEEMTGVVGTGRDIVLSTGGLSVRASPIGSGAHVDEGSDLGLGSEGTSAVLSWSSGTAGVKVVGAWSSWRGAVESE